MFDEKKRTGEIPDEQSELTEKDLEGVSGGLWGITIIDTCAGRFYKEICETNTFGPCPHLSVVKESNNNRPCNIIETITTYSCSKGCFKKTQLTSVEEF